MFTAREYDAETGLYYYRLRYYDPLVGRFLQEDPWGYYDSMNLYEYCWNDPVNWMDPFGLFVDTGFGPPGDVFDIPLGNIGDIYIPPEIGDILPTPDIPLDLPQLEELHSDEGGKGGESEKPASKDERIRKKEKEHTKGERGSTKDKHEKGKSRKKRDRGGEKGDIKRRAPRRRPPDWKGPWPTYNIN